MFSIVIPTYNHGHLLPRCIESIIGQTYEDWELIIVNNASTDNTIEVIEGYQNSKIRYINFNNDEGIAASRNVGIRAAKGDYICFLDSDDWWKENKLEVCSRYINDYDLIYHDLDIVNAHRSKDKFRKRLYSREIPKEFFLEDMFINGNPIKNSSVVLSKKIVDKIGFLDENLELMAVEDFDYWIRAIKGGAKTKYIAESLGYYWKGNNTSYKMIQIQRYESLLNKYKGEISSKKSLKLADKMFCFLKGRIYHTNGFFGKALRQYIKSLDIRTAKFKFAILGILCCLLRIKI
jgi:hypothetical protein